MSVTIDPPSAESVPLLTSVCADMAMMAGCHAAAALCGCSGCTPAAPLHPADKLDLHGHEPAELLDSAHGRGEAPLRGDPSKPCSARPCQARSCKSLAWPAIEPPEE